MSGSMKNIIVLLGIATIAFAGYYFYTQQSVVLEDTSGGQQLQEMLMRTQVFIQRSQQLDQVVIDGSIFEDPRFISLRTYTTAPQDVPVGRTDPFATAGRNISSQVAE